MILLRLLFVMAILVAAPAMGKDPAVSLWNEAQVRYQAKLREEHVVASTTVLLRDGKVIAAANFGVDDITTNRPTDLKSIYHWGSVTKTFTSIAIMQLRDRGLLKLDDPVVRYVPNFGKIYNPYGKIETITLRDLLTHSAGLRNTTWPWNAGKGWEPFEPPSYAQIEAMFPYTEIEFQPGSKYSYSNLGYAVLGQVIEAVSHEPYVAYIDKHIFKPLKMHGSYFNLTPDHLRPYRVQSYAVTDAGALIDQGGDFDTGATVANGGLNAPVDDMIVYASFLSGAGSDDNYRFVLSRDSIAELHTKILPSGEEAGLTTYRGLGFLTGETATHQFFAHGGFQRLYRTTIMISPVNRMAYIRAVNTTGPRGRNTATDIIDDTVIFKIFGLGLEQK
ncbi:CubicO group peptidase (beta-lactamase class C family) [Erythromicrobium ramosum]|uniref:CubicO group peptidase (Beta-lactamase class C family) n=1 Tax=Erythrobacter ramosus TaxID=35811 RepID=A0A6I4UE00_9SPHN|nr:serine hydrolase domain-containing protein [Erythrobacter ramosus]MBB3775244.1 CubicO group peptidase (beta-lactamase class C family) [Erythrobacter ramosus]MXP37132.1 serine hydrolase [Erythrobacter ramosus]